MFSPDLGQRHHPWLVPLIVCPRCLDVNVRARNGVGWNKPPVYQALPDLPDPPGLLVVVGAVVVAVAAAHLPLVRLTSIP